MNINLDVSKVSSMLQTSPGVGIIAYEAVANVGVDIVASQLAHVFPNTYSPPTLTLGYSVPSFPARECPWATTIAMLASMRPTIQSGAS